MDVLLAFCDQHFFTPYVYPTSWTEDNIFRQFLTLNIITDVAGALFYLITATINYVLVYDKRLLKHPLMLEVSYCCLFAYTYDAE
jgi:lathosterol oxidase